MTSLFKTVKIPTATLLGVEGRPVTVAVSLIRRLPCMVIVGMPGGAVRESAERVRSSVVESGYEFPRMRVVVNLAPAELRKRGCGFDLPIAIGVLAASKQVEMPAKLLGKVGFIGELGLGGDVRSVRGVLPLVEAMRDAGCEAVVVPESNLAEAMLVEGVAAWPCQSLCDAVDILSKIKGDIPPHVTGKLTPWKPPQWTKFALDMSEVKGQHRPRRALEIAAAGGHNILLVGPPGCGKTMLAARMSTILPAMSREEALEVTRVHSAAGLLLEGAGICTQRPFRAPHHTVTPAAMMGNAALRPGELSLANHGVLMLDELPEFRRPVVEPTARALQDGEVSVCRAAGTVKFPTKPLVIAAANPCPCGYAGHPERVCRCRPEAIERYRKRLTGPLMDQVDLQVWVQPVPVEVLVNGPPGEGSASIRWRVTLAVHRRKQREARESVAYAETAFNDSTDGTQKTVGRMRVAYAMSEKDIDKLWRVARTIADLDGSETIDEAHVLEASAYRLGWG